MKNMKLFLCGFLLILCVSACSEPSMEEEARNAAFLTKTSMEFSALNDLKTAEKNYIEAQRIIEKYRTSDKFMEFYEKYNAYLQELTESENYESLYK